MTACQNLIDEEKDYSLVLEKITAIVDYLNLSLDFIHFKPVIYDEIEFFTTGTTYPYKRRKSDLPFASSFTMKSGATGNTDMIKVHQIRLRKSIVCFDQDILSEFFFWKEEKCDPENDAGFDFQKIKFTSHFFEEQRIGPIGEVHFIMQFALDSQKQISVVTSYKMLEFLGDLGGFLEAIQIVFSLVGSYFRILECPL